MLLKWPSRWNNQCPMTGESSASGFPTDQTDKISIYNGGKTRRNMRAGDRFLYHQLLLFTLIIHCFQSEAPYLLL